NSANTWHLTGTNAGDLGSAITYSNTQNLTGGTSADTFSFGASAGSVTGTINGGGGTGLLDYALKTSAVTVNLGAGTATAAGGVTDVENVTTGSGADVLAGN